MYIFVHIVTTAHFDTNTQYLRKYFHSRSYCSIAKLVQLHGREIFCGTFDFSPQDD